jgi:ADP-ribose pyrophosphatase YjhB (NUDIX family)
MDTPPPNIRVTALCLLRHPSDARKILVARSWDSDKRSHFCRPLGGGVEFGERAEDAVRREMREEIGQELEGVQLLGVVENLFTLEGRAGHEIVFLFDATLCDRSLYERAEITGFEASIPGSDAGGEYFSAFWATPEEIAARGDRLVPEELVALLRG